jgi:hypothetical protein
MTALPLTQPSKTMKITFQQRPNIRTHLMVPIGEFSFAAYPIQVNHALRRFPVTGRPQTKLQALSFTTLENETTNNH